MDHITQTFYDELAPQYDKLFSGWQDAAAEQAELLDGLLRSFGFDRSARVLDCACGIGTQAIGLAALGYAVTASDISDGALAQATARAAERGADIRFRRADFRALEQTFSETFDVVITMDNALPHMDSAEALEAAVRSIVGRLRPSGLFLASIRDYDALLQTKPPYSPPYIHKTEGGQRVAFQTWDWTGDVCRLTQYIIEDEGALRVSRFACAYRAVRRDELTQLLRAGGCTQVDWLLPEQTGFYQPIVAARK